MFAAPNLNCDFRAHNPQLGGDYSRRLNSLERGIKAVIAAILLAG
jgi:hypothetical protein